MSYSPVLVRVSLAQRRRIGYDVLRLNHFEPHKSEWPEDVDPILVITFRFGNQVESDLISFTNYFHISDRVATLVQMARDRACRIECLGRRNDRGWYASHI